MNKAIKVVGKKNLSTDKGESYKVSEEQKQFYNDNGYLVIKDLIDFTTLYSCKQRFVQIVNGVADGGNIRIIKEEPLIGKVSKAEDLVNKCQDILYDEVFCLYSEHPRLLCVLRQFIGDDVTAMHSMLINKPPGTTRHPPHQDMHYFPFRPVDKIIASWTAIDEVTLENGCLFVVPGSHKAAILHKHGYVDNTMKLYHGILDEYKVAPLDARVYLEMNPGDTVFFHPLLVHGSGANTTNRHRKSISVHYANSGCHYIDVEGSPHSELAKEFEQMLKKYKMSYTDHWKYKSKQVCGVRSNL